MCLSLCIKLSHVTPNYEKSLKLLPNYAENYIEPAPNYAEEKQRKTPDSVKVETPIGSSI